MSAPQVAVDQVGDAAVVRFEPPGQRLSAEAAGELASALRGAAGGSGVRAIVLAGGQNFCVGADLRQRAELPEGRWAAHHAPFEELTRALHEVRQPTIAAVRGWALGGGAEMALGCDIVVAAPTARFGLPEALRGVVPGMGGPHLLQRRTTHGFAAYLLYTGADVDARTALEHGLVTFLDEDPEASALGIAQAVGRAAPTAVAALRDLLRLPAGDFAAAYPAELAAWRRSVACGDALEGARAFVGRRAPVFRVPEPGA